HGEQLRPRSAGFNPVGKSEESGDWQLLGLFAGPRRCTGHRQQGSSLSDGALGRMRADDSALSAAFFASRMLHAFAKENYGLAKSTPDGKWILRPSHWSDLVHNRREAKPRKAPKMQRERERERNPCNFCSFGPPNNVRCPLISSVRKSIIKSGRA